MRDDLHCDVCSGCGETIPINAGILYHATHACPLNIVKYRMPVGMSFLRMWDEMVSEMVGKGDSMRPFRDLLNFPYLKKMPDIQTASIIDRIIYSHCRDSDIRTMKRLRAYIELEEDFNAKY